MIHSEAYRQLLRKFGLCDEEIMILTDRTNFNNSGSKLIEDIIRKARKTAMVNYLYSAVLLAQFLFCTGRDTNNLQTAATHIADCENCKEVMGTLSQKISDINRKTDDKPAE